MSVSVLMVLSLSLRISRSSGFLFTPAIWLLLSGVAVVGVTEGLSAFQVLDTPHVFCVWFLFLLTGAFWLKNHMPQGLRELPSQFVPRSRFEFFSIITLFTLLVVSFYLALASPPNNGDAIGYHNTRILHWVAQRNVSHFYSPDFRLIRMPPFASFLRLHALLLTGNDWLFNFTQWIAYFISILIASLMGWELSGGNRTAACGTALFVATIPMAVLQASSSQNDLTLGALLLAAAFILLLTKRNPRPTLSGVFYGMFWGLIGLTTLVKGTGYIFGAILVMSSIPGQWRVLGEHLRVKTYQKLLPIFLGIFCAVLCNLPHLVRNATFPKAQSEDVVIVPLKTWFSDGPQASVQKAADQIFKSALLEFDIFKKLPGVKEKILNLNLALERALSRPSFDPDLQSSKEADLKYFLMAPLPDEDYAGSFLHIFLILIAGSLILDRDKARKVGSETTIALGLTMLGALAFIFLIRWMPWNNRLVLPLVMLSAAPTMNILVQTHSKKVLMGFILMAAAYSSIFLFMNYAHPLLSLGRAKVQPFYARTRWENLFRDNSALRIEVDKTLTFVSEDCKDSRAGNTIELAHGAMGYEYYFWVGARKMNLPFHFEYSNPNGRSQGHCALIDKCGENEPFSLKECSANSNDKNSELKATQ